MPSLIAAKAFLSSKWPYMAAGVVILGTLLLLAYCTGRSDGKSGEVIKQQDREIKIIKEVGKANEGAAGRRVRDSQRSAEQQREIEDAVRNATDPDDARARRGCVILRQQGRDTSSIPACSGLSSGS